MSDDQVLEPLSRSATDHLEYHDAEHTSSSATSHTAEESTSKVSTVPGSSFFTTSDDKEMLDLVDNLRKIDRVSDTIPLPRIIVIGQQSSGKSSVLNAITGISFPVDTGMTTRFPTEIILRRTDNTQTKVSFRPSPNPSKQEAFDLFENHWRSEGVTLARLPEVIASATTALKFEGATCFSKETLVLEICGPEQENLTLIDLPGLITSTKKNQDNGDIQYVADIVDKYMDRELTIMLAVFTGTTDFENQILTQKLKDNEVYSQRSLGVITAPDAIQADSVLENDCLEHIHNQNLNLGFGWHVLRNLNSQEVKRNLDRNELEKAFFETQSPWRSINKTQVGYQALKKRLSAILYSSIRKALPDIKQEIQGSLSNCKRQLDSLGAERSTPDQQKEYLRKCSELYKEEITGALEGNPRYRELAGADMSLRSRINVRGEAFTTTMSERGQSWKLVPKLNSKENQVQRLKLVDDVVGGRLKGRFDTTKELFEADMLLWLSANTKRHQGQEPSNLIDPLWAGELFKYQIRNWKGLAQTYLNNVFDDVQEYITGVVKTTFGKEVSGRVWKVRVLPGMKQLKVDLDRKLTEICKPYFGRYPQTLNKRYHETLRTLQSKRLEASESDKSGPAVDNTGCYQLLDTVDAWYNVCSDVFIDNVQNLVIEHCLLDELKALAGTSYFRTIDDITSEMIAGESPGKKEIREQLIKDKEQYQKALDEFIPSLEVRGFDRDDFLESNDSFHRYAGIASAPPESVERKTPAEAHKSRPKVHEEFFENLVSKHVEAEAPVIGDSQTGPYSNTLYAPARSRILPQTTPQKVRRRRNVSESLEQPHASLEANDDFSSPSTVCSGSSQQDTASSVSSYQNSPQPPMKTKPLDFIVHQEPLIGSSGS